MSVTTTARAGGWFFVLAAVASIVGLLLYQPLTISDPFSLGSGSDTRVLAGALAEFLLVVGCIGTAATMFTLLRAHQETLALGYALGRTIEAVAISVGALSVLSALSLRDRGTDAASATVAGSLIALHDWTFLWGPGLAIGVNTSLLAYLMFRSRLVPRAIAVIGLVGGPMVFASSTLVLFGVYEQLSAWAAPAALVVTAWEMSLAGWLIIRGVNPQPGHRPDHGYAAQPSTAKGGPDARTMPLRGRGVAPRTTGT
jgi:hypothetical protein